MNLSGQENVTEFFGAWPDFHDSEVLEILISRDGASHIDVHCIDWRIEPAQQVASIAREGVVRFLFGKITTCEIAGQDVNVQNVLQSVFVEEVESCVRVVLNGVFGITGFVEGQDVSVALLRTPLKSR